MADAATASWAEHIKRDQVANVGMEKEENVNSQDLAGNKSSGEHARAEAGNVQESNSALHNDGDLYANVIASATSTNRDHPDNWTSENTSILNLSDFELEHFHPNVLPDQPCSACFYTHDYIPTKDIRKNLERDGVRMRDVRCLQRKPNNEVMITFTRKAVYDHFLAVTSFRVCRKSYFVRSASTPYTFQTVYDAPHELPDSAIHARLAPHCTVRSGRWGKCQENQEIFNGICHYQVELIKPVPWFIRFGRFQIRLIIPTSRKPARSAALRNISPKIVKQWSALIVNRPAMSPKNARQTDCVAFAKSLITWPFLVYTHGVDNLIRRKTMFLIPTIMMTTPLM